MESNLYFDKYYIKAEKKIDKLKHYLDSLNNIDDIILFTESIKQFVEENIKK